MTREEFAIDTASDESVGYTASWMAAARALESQRSQPLVVDPWAQKLAGPEGERLLAHFHGEHTDAGHPALAVRHRWFDEWLLATVRPGDQVVGLGTGLETRPWRIRWPSGVTLWQIDQPEVLGRRERVMSDVPPGCAVTTVGATLDEDWTSALRDAGHDPTRRTIWYVEGVLFYLPEALARRVLRDAARASAPDSLLAADFIDPNVFQFVGMSMLLKRLSAAGSPWQFTTASPGTFLQECGWNVQSVTQPGAPDAHYGRWPREWELDADTPQPRTYLTHSALI